MNNLEKLLIGANLYSIEYTGIFSLKFFLHTESTIFNTFNDLIIEFVEGCILYNDHNNRIPTDMHILKLFGLDIIKVEIKKNNQLKFIFENHYSIETIFNSNELFDRSWVLRTLDSKSYILNDRGDIFLSEDFKAFLDI